MQKTFTFLFILFSLNAFSQYSDYYIVDQNVNANVNINKNVNVNQNVDVSGHVRKTVTTIDYGALAQANAMSEANRLAAQKIAIEQQQYSNQLAREKAILYSNQALEIAADPFKADTYGTRSSFSVSYSDPGFENIVNLGFMSFVESYTVPHTSLFQNVGAGRFTNSSENGITTEIITELSRYNNKGWPLLTNEAWLKYSNRIFELNREYQFSEKPIKKNYPNKEQFEFEVQRWNQMCDSLDNWGYFKNPKEFSEGIIVGTKLLQGDGDSIYVHKIEVVKRTVYGNPGFRHTLVWEDDYNICITDNYHSYYRGIESHVKVRYKADKSSNIGFEDLEGRRFYLIRLVDRHVAGRSISSPVYATPRAYPKRKNYKDFESWSKAMSRFN